MAKFSAGGVDSLLKDLSSLNMELIAPKMLERAAPVLEKNVKKRSEAHKASGEMYKSIKKTKAKRKKDRWSITVRPTGKDSKTGVRNMEKMAYLEYGTSRQAATPVLTPAVNESESSCVDAMQAAFNEETERLGL